MHQNVWKTTIILLFVLQLSLAWNLKLFAGTTSDYITVTSYNASEIFNYPKYFNKSRVVLIHGFGYTNTLASEGTQLFLTAHLEPNDKNVGLLDWSEEADGGPLPTINYPIAVEKCLAIGQQFGAMLVNLVKYGLNLNATHLTGQSLGAHLMGAAGRECQRSGYLVWRISGLDPAGPEFDGPLPLRPRLSKSDAFYVDNYHTDPAKYGIKTFTGTIDFNFNIGFFKYCTNVQPGCPRGFYPPLSKEDICSHRRVYDYLAEAKRNPTSFIASKASSYDEWVYNNGAEIETTYIGDLQDLTKTGSYFLSTNGESPYGRGIDGLKP